MGGLIDRNVGAHERLVEWEGKMIRLLTAGTRIWLVVAAMAVAVPMITFPQTSQPTTESEPAVAKAAVANASPTSDENSTDTDTSLKTVPLAKSSIPAAVENELRRELLDDRAAYIDRWLSVIAIVLTFFSIVAVVLGYIGFKRFREIETEAKSSTETAKEHAAVAKKLVDEIKEKRDEGERIIQNLNAQTAADHPEKAKQAVLSVRENPRASLVDEAIANAISLQQQGKRDDAIERWRAVAHIAERSDDALAATARFSVGYLIQDENPEDALADYAEAIRLKPDYAEAYNNRGAVKAALGRHDDAIADYAEAIRLKPDHASPYYNLGIGKAKLGRYDDALADYAEAIRLKPDHDGAFYNRGVAKDKLGRYEDALADYDEAIRLKPDYASAYNNRGAVKDALGRHDDALADYDEAIRLKPDLAEAYGNRGNAKNALGLKDEARKDFETTLELARNANNAGVVAQAEQSLRDLDDGA